MKNLSVWRNLRCPLSITFRSGPSAESRRGPNSTTAQQEATQRVVFVEKSRRRSTADRRQTTDDDVVDVRSVESKSTAAAGSVDARTSRASPVDEEHRRPAQKEHQQEGKAGADPSKKDQVRLESVFSEN